MGIRLDEIFYFVNKNFPKSNYFNMRDKDTLILENLYIKIIKESEIQQYESFENLIKRVGIIQAIDEIYEGTDEKKVEDFLKELDFPLSQLDLKEIVQVKYKLPYEQVRNFIIIQEKYYLKFYPKDKICFY
jgi:hypothetical protein